ncbi:hypothetical protein [Streptomyces sp. NPDC057496]|uniref:hypothetical protein n=1 Tax=Streptomyces sp. NPDC057496 TaxID=3346149 RepID=UPI0036B7EC07
MFRVLLEQWQANQEQKRELAAEKWEQEKRWREEDRQEQRQKKAEQERLKQEKEREREETFTVLYRAHLRVMKKAVTVSYLSLVCHEDTWTFLARRAFGHWSPEWVTSVRQDQPGRGGPVAKDEDFRKDPNLTPGRITKQDNGMQTVDVSGDNLVTILDRLWDSAYGGNTFENFRDTDPNRGACGPLYCRFENWLESFDEGTAGKPGHALVLDERIDAVRPV